ncbi:unnamed protein product [Schistosoma margrebowiei]|uniref:Uncharacterized protein n=1 Tax=Schistosoma margrebowiei TaxID=48269 RepID=A0A183N932_9TREM|nr:unnamed protein product [Schistosoma margrebowiei]
MERSNNVGNRSNSNGNEEIQLSSTGNQRNPMDPSWTEKASYGEMLLYSGHEENNAPYTQGFALMLSKVARNALVGWESHGSRIIKASFKTKKEGILMNIIQCYAPTNDSNDDIKDQFYERLQSVIEKCPRKDLTILMRDLNAKVRIDNTGYEDIMGRHGLGERNDNGERFCKSMTMEDVRTRRGADVASDHHLVVTNLKLKLKKNWTSGQTALQRFNTAFLRDTDKLNEFKIALNNRFQALQDLLKEEETSMEDNWKSIKEALTSTCQEVLGLKKYHHKEWISTETLDKIKERKNKKAAINNSRTRAGIVQAQAEYIEANKQVKRKIRDGKKKYVQELATTAEKAAREGNMKQLHDTTKKLAWKYSKPERPVKDKEGKSITEIQQQRNGWVEYFEELLNWPAPMNPPDIEAAHRSSYRCQPTNDGRN